MEILSRRVEVKKGRNLEWDVQQAHMSVMVRYRNDTRILQIYIYILLEEGKLCKCSESE